MHRQVQTHTRCNWKNITYVRNQMENDLVYAKGRCVSSTIQLSSWSAEEQGRAKTHLQNRNKTRQCWKCGRRERCEGLSAVWLLTAPAGLGPGLHPLSPSWADTDGREERQSGVSLYEPSSCQATLLHDCREPNRVRRSGVQPWLCPSPSFLFICFFFVLLGHLSWSFCST